MIWVLYPVQMLRMPVNVSMLALSVGKLLDLVGEKWVFVVGNVGVVGVFGWDALCLPRNFGRELLLSAAFESLRPRFFFL